jgi:hypothetical protein
VDRDLVEKPLDGFDLERTREEESLSGLAVLSLQGLEL